MSRFPVSYVSSSLGHSSFGKAMLVRLTALPLSLSRALSIATFFIHESANLWPVILWPGTYCMVGVLPCLYGSFAHPCYIPLGLLDETLCVAASELAFPACCRTARERIPRNGKEFCTEGLLSPADVESYPVPSVASVPVILRLHTGRQARTRAQTNLH